VLLSNHETISRFRNGLCPRSIRGRTMRDKPFAGAAVSAPRPLVELRQKSTRSPQP
jgi:hypothetical protein